MRIVKIENSYYNVYIPENAVGVVLGSNEHFSFVNVNGITIRVPNESLMETENSMESSISYKSDFSMEPDISEALIAYDYMIHISLNPRNDFTRSIPDGWMLAGIGGSRVSILSPSNTVYKIPYNVDLNPSLNEYKTIFEIHDIMPRGWAVPKAGLYTINGVDLIMMEMIQSTYEHYYCSFDSCTHVDDSIPPFVRDGFSNKSNFIISTDGIKYLVDLDGGIDRNALKKYKSSMV